MACALPTIWVAATALAAAQWSVRSPNGDGESVSFLSVAER